MSAQLAITTENHHPDKKHHPKVTVKMSRKEHQRLHEILPKDNPLSRAMRQYDALTKLIVSMKNWRTAFEKDFGVCPDIDIESVERNKKQITQEIKQLVTTERQKIKHIKGFGSIYLAGILAYAHPCRFTSLRRFLFYCGFTQASRKLKKYNRKVKPIMHEVTKHVIMNKDAKYYPFYLKLKDDLRQRNPNNTKKGIDMMARNRIGTYLLKEVYELFRVENREILTYFPLLIREGLLLESTLDLHT